jgi:hypothetical protein
MTKALESWQPSYQLDSTNAGVSYHAGMAFVRQKDYESAGLSLVAGKGLMTFAFRARTYFPRICRDLASLITVLLADVESYFVQQSQRTYLNHPCSSPYVHPMIWAFITSRCCLPRPWSMVELSWCCRH